MIKRPLFTAVSLFICIVAVLAGGFRIFPDQRPSLLESHVAEKVPIQVVGTVYRKEEKQENQFLYLKDTQAVLKGHHYKESKILIQIESKYHIYIGNKIEVTGKVRIISPARNPGNFDQREYYRKKGIHVKVEADSCKIKDPDVYFVREKLFQFRNYLKGRIIAGMGQEYGSVMSAILLGDKSELDPDIKELYQKNGIGHVLAISGLHMSFLGIGLYELLRKLGLSFWKAGGIGFTMLFLYTLMIGSGISALRALIMFAIRMGAEVTGRQYDMVTSVGVSAAVLALWQPLFLFDAGFLLSFGALVGIGVVMPCFQYVFGRKVRFEKLKESVLSSLSVNLILLPVMLYFYYEFPLYSIFLNLLVIPLMSVVMTCGVSGMLLSCVWLNGGSLIFLAAKAVLLFYEKLCRFTMYLPFSRIVTGKPHPAGIILYYICLTAFCLFISFCKEKELKLKNTVTGIVVVFVLCLIMSASCFFAHLSWNRLTVTMVDVGQGDGIFIKGPGGTTFFIDGGSTDVKNVGTMRLEPFLKSQGVSKLDYVLISHGDADHRNGIEELLEDQKMGIRIGSVVLPEKRFWDENLTNFADKALSSGTKLKTIKENDVLKDKELTLKCLGPAMDYEGPAGNEASMVLEAEYGRFRMLFTGDLEGEGERDLEASGKLKKLHVLKVAHHGSKNSTSEDFLMQTEPEVALISSGINNRHGHPHKETLDKLKNAGCEIRRTNKNGAVLIRTDGKKIHTESFIK